MAAKIINVKNLTFSNSTKLSLTLDIVTSKLLVTPIAPTYYHFKYPSATQLIIVRKSINSGRSINIQFPATFSYADISAFYQANADTNTGCYDLYVQQISNELHSLYLNDELIIPQWVADLYAPRDDAQYTDILAKVNVANVLRFGNLSRQGSESDCKHSFAVAIVY